MVVCGKEGFGSLPILVYVLHYGPGYGHTVKGAGAPAYLIQKHKRARREVMQNGRGLCHLYHKGGLSLGDIV